METKNIEIYGTNQEIETIYLFIPTPVPLDSLTIQLYLRERYNRAPKKLFILQEILNTLKNNCTFKLQTIADRARCRVRHVQRVIDDLLELGLLNKALRFMQTTVFKLSSWFFQPEIKCWFKNWLYNNLNLLYLCLSSRKAAADRDDVLLRSNKEINLRKWALLLAYASPIMTITSWGQLRSAGCNKSYVNNFLYANIPDCQASGTDGNKKLTLSEWDALFSNNRRPDSIPPISRLDYEATTQEHSLQIQKQDEVHERIQSDTGIYPGDTRTEADQVGTDQANCFFRTRRPSRNLGIQDGTQTARSLCSCIFCSAGLQQSEQFESGLYASGFFEEDIQHARECADGASHGYGNDSEEIFD